MAGKVKNYIQTGTISQNRKAHFNYSILQTLEAGIALIGSEIKSLRLGRANLGDSYATFENDTPVLLNLNITPYNEAGYFGHKATRPRTLLLHKKEAQKIRGQINQKGYTLIPLELYFNNRGIAKVKLGLAVGKNTVDKRETIKQRDWNRQKHRILKNYT